MSNLSYPSALSLLVLLSPFATATATLSCGAKSTALHSTDTGNPPVIGEQAISVVASGDDVLVSGSAGAISPAGAEVEVTNIETGQSATTTADDDGSFEVTLPGSLEDEYTVEVSADGRDATVTVGGSTQTPAAPSAGDPGDQPPTGTNGLALEGKAYLLQTADGYTPVADAKIRITFSEDNNFGFSAGCNGHGGAYTLCEGDRLCIEGLGSTEIGCSPELHAQDEWLATLFTNRPTLTQNAESLTVLGQSAALEFLDEKVADPNLRLTGNLWTVDTFISGQAASNLALPNPPTLLFNADSGSTAEVSTGCNAGGGNYEEGDDELTFAGFGFTEAACENDAAAEAEEKILQLFANGQVTFEIDRKRLTLMRGDEGISATAMPE